MRRASLIWGNDYLRLSLIFALFYIITHAFTFPLSSSDYIIALYITFLYKIHEENALQYGILFGLAYDLNYQIYLGVGIILFMLMNFVKVQLFQMIDMSKIYSRLLFKGVCIAVYTFLTLNFFGWPNSTFMESFVYFTLTSALAALILWVITGGSHVIRRA